MVFTVKGTDFRPDSSVSWNSSLRPTTFVSSHQLKVTITAGDITNPGMVTVFVFNPPETSTTSVSGAIGMGTVANCSGKGSNIVSVTIRTDLVLVRTPFDANFADGLNDICAPHHPGWFERNELEPVGRHQVLHRL